MANQQHVGDWGVEMGGQRLHESEHTSVRSLSPSLTACGVSNQPAQSTVAKNIAQAHRNRRAPATWSKDEL